MKAAVYNKDGLRGRSVLRALPGLPSYRRVLYIGANEKRFHLYGMLRDKELHVLEVFRPYADGLRLRRDRPVTSIILGDVCAIAGNAEVNALRPFDLVVWWHGPEHVLAREAYELLRPGGILEGYWTRAILVGCPWGVHEQPAINGNPHQAHVSTYYPDWFELLGYRWVVLGKMDDPGGHITAWKTRT